MRSINDIVNTLETLFDTIKATRDRRTKLRPELFSSENQYEEIDSKLKEEEFFFRNQIISTIKAYERFPERYSGHYLKLKDFYSQDEKDHGENSVFIMTKFPDSTHHESGPLENVIESVKSAVIDQGYVPRLALDADHHEWLWDNVELFLLGCAQGIAIVEDKYYPELNPNVAMEWGWMRAMGRRVLFLRENSFVHDRADWSGLIHYDFDWKDPEASIQQAVEKFLKK